MWTPADNPPPLTVPDRGGVVRSELVLVTDGRDYSLARWSTMPRRWARWYITDDLWDWRNQPTHWHPLPPLPQEEPERFPDDDRDLPF